MEYFNFEVGGDIRLARIFVLGPFVGLRLGQFSHLSVEGTGITPQSADIPKQALHEWIAFGVRGAFTL
jgi:hypothetical protein